MGELLTILNKEEMLKVFLKNGVSPSLSVNTAKTLLKLQGFKLLSYSDDSFEKIENGGKYMVSFHDTVLYAFTIGENYVHGQPLRMAAAHTDYPCLRIKPSPDFKTHKYAQVNVEVYGGPILNTWFDRPLGVAGRVVVKGKDTFHPDVKLYCSSKPVMVIPNLAIHMNKEINKGVEINRQVDLMPILDIIPDGYTETGYFLSFLSEDLDIMKEDILSFELNTFIMDKPCKIGPRNTLLSSPRLDNQTSVAALVYGLIHSGREDGINLIALFDHEEIGSKGKQGASSSSFFDTIERILLSLSNNKADINKALYESIMLSVDVAHAMHPNHKEKMDITNLPALGYGLCIKEACSQSYATDAEAIAILKQILNDNNIPYQIYVNRSDAAGGGTLGIIASSNVPVRTIDIGIPVLAMHSAQELMGTNDFYSLCNCIIAFFA